MKKDMSAHKILLRLSNVCIELQEHSHFGMSQGFAGDITLHLGLVDCVDCRPHYATANYYAPESMSFQGIWIKTVIEMSII